MMMIVMMTIIVIMMMISIMTTMLMMASRCEKGQCQPQKIEKARNKTLENENTRNAEHHSFHKKIINSGGRAPNTVEGEDQLKDN